MLRGRTASGHILEAAPLPGAPRAAGAGTCLLFRGPRERPVFANPFTIAKIEESLTRELVYQQSCVRWGTCQGDGAEILSKRSLLFSMAGLGSPWASLLVHLWTMKGKYPFQQELSNTDPLGSLQSRKRVC